MSLPGQIPPNIIRGAGTVSREQIIQEQQQQAEQARIDAAQRAQAQKEQQAQEQAARARQNTVSTSRSNPNVFFNEKTGQYDFIVQPTYDDPYGQRAVSRSDVNPAYFQTDAGKQLGKQFDELQANAETQQDFQLFKGLQSQGIDPGVLTINRNAAGDITGGSGSKNNVQLQVGPNNSLNVSYSQPSPVGPVQPPNSASEAAIVNQVVAKANFFGAGTQFGYAISKDAAGNITGFESTVFAPAGVQQSPQALSLAYAAFKENQIIKAQNAGAPSAYGLTNGDISALKGAGFSNVLPYASKPNVHYTVNLQDSISGNFPGPQPIETEFYIPDITNPFIVQSKREYLEQNYYTPNPTVPFDIRPKVTTEIIKAPVIAQPVDNSFAAGFGNYFGNIGELAKFGGSKAIGQNYEANYQPEIESSTISTLVNAGENAVLGKQQTLGQDLGEIANFIVRNPQYAAGSLAASLLFTVGTFGAGKAVTGVRAGVDILKGFNAATKITDVIKGAEGVTETADLTSQALKVTKAGQEAPLAKVGPLFIETKQVGKVPFMVESEVTGISKVPVFGFGEKLRLTGIGTKGISIKTPAAPALFNIESRTYDAEGIISSVTDIGKTSTKTGTTAIFTDVLDKESALAAVGQKIAPAASMTVQDSKLGTVGLDLGSRVVNAGKQGGKPLALSYTEITQNEADVFKNIGSYTRIRGNTGITTPIVKTAEGAKVAEKPRLGAILEYSNKDLANYGSALRKSSATSKSIGKVTSPFSSSVKSASIGKKGTSTIVNTLTESNREITKNAATKAFNSLTEKASAKSSSTGSIIPGLAGTTAKAIGGFSGYAARQAKSNAAGVNLGFGGATGAERKAAKKAVEELTQSFIPVPETSSKSSTNSISKTLQNLTSNTSTKSQNSLIPTEITKGLTDVLPKQGSVLNSLLSTNQAQSSRTSTRTETAAISGIAAALMPALSTKQAQGFRFDLVTKTPFPSKEPPVFDFNLPGFGSSKKEKTHKKKKYRYGERAFKRTDIVANSVSATIAKILNESIGPVE